LSTLLTVENLTKAFGPRLVLSDISFTVRAGEVLGLIGPNGAGKTTVLECLAGLVPMTSGNLLSGDKSLALGRRKELLFYMPDGILPWSEHRVHWVLEFFEKLYRRAPEQIASLTDALRLHERSSARVSQRFQRVNANVSCWHSVYSRRSRCCCSTNHLTVWTYVKCARS